MSDTNYSEFIDRALRTESRFSEVRFNKDLFDRTLQVAIDAGELTDIIKKKVAYNKPYTADQWNDLVDAILENVSHMKVTQEELDHQDDLNVNPRLFHGTIGLATEATEMLQALMNAHFVGEWDLPNLKEEVGDQAWYTAILLDEIAQTYPDSKATYQQILDRVIEKLAKRYPEKYTDENAIVRDLAAEREILEK